MLFIFEIIAAIYFVVEGLVIFIAGKRQAGTNSIIKKFVIYVIEFTATYSCLQRPGA